MPLVINKIFIGQKICGFFTNGQFLNAGPFFDPDFTNLLIQQTPKPEAQFPCACAITSPSFEHSSAVTQIPVIAGVESVVHSALGNVTTENKENASKKKTQMLIRFILTHYSPQAVSM